MLAAGVALASSNEEQEEGKSSDQMNKDESTQAQSAANDLQSKENAQKDIHQKEEAQSTQQDNMENSQDKVTAEASQDSQGLNQENPRREDGGDMA